MTYRARWSHRLLLLGLTWAILGVQARRDLSAAEPAKAANEKTPEAKPGERWVRVTRDQEGEPLALETAIVRYQSTDPKHPDLVVDLIGAIHIADRAYYDKLNRQFEQYDALLYELVAPPGTRIEPGEKHESRHPVSQMQNGMKDLLELEHQLVGIDYTKKNFVHADMSPKEFSKTMAARDESFAQMLFKLMGVSLAEQSAQQARGQATNLDLFMAFFQPDRALHLKRVMAGQFEQMGALLTGFSGEDGSTIITERNKKALEVLARQIAQGREKIGIFYGAGHMEDMSARLEKEFHLKPVKVFWVEAWNLRDE